MENPFVNMFGSAPVPAVTVPDLPGGGSQTGGKSGGWAVFIVILVVCVVIAAVYFWQEAQADKARAKARANDDKLTSEFGGAVIVHPETEAAKRLEPSKEGYLKELENVENLPVNKTNYMLTSMIKAKADHDRQMKARAEWMNDLADAAKAKEERELTKRIQNAKKFLEQYADFLFVQKNIPNA